MSFDFDLIVIGGGSGGVRGARMAAAKGVKVALIEGDRMGGTCVIRGCVPKKILSFGSHGFEDVHCLGGYGYKIDQPRFDWSRLITAKDQEIDRLERAYSQVLENARVAIFRGWAQFKDPHTVKIGNKKLSAERFLIATGGCVSIPNIPGAEFFITSNEAFHLPTLPERVAVYGGGYIAVEFASIFSGLGAETSLIYRGDMPLRGFDEDLRTHFLNNLKTKPLSLVMKRSISHIEATEDGTKTLFFDDGSAQKVDVVMAATGRNPNTRALNLKAIGVETGAKGQINVDEFSQTSQPHIYAVGDVTSRMALTPVAINEAMAFVDTVYGGRPRKQSYDHIATAVFSNPEICTVGLTEQEARATYDKGRIYSTSFRAMVHILPKVEERTFIKLLVENASDRVVGLHIVGLHAAEIVQGFAVAMNAGATKAHFDTTVGIHPTSAEEVVTMREPTGTW